jgi:mRNA interferase YafQ
MLALYYTTRFKKDIKRLQKRGKDLRKLYDIIEKLRDNKALPVKNRAHRLTGDWKDFWECHIEPDWLLVYHYDSATLYLTASGTHSDLFEK